MQVTVIDNTKIKAYTCSFTKAASIIGVCSKTISRWSIDRKFEHYNHFTVYFDTEIIKQPVRNCLIKQRIKGQKRNF